MDSWYVVFLKNDKKNGKNDTKKKGRGGTVLMPVIRQIKFRKKQYERWRFESWFPKYSLGNISVVYNTPVWRLAHKVKNTQGCSYLQFMLRETD